MKALPGRSWPCLRRFSHASAGGGARYRRLPAAPAPGRGRRAALEELHDFLDARSGQYRGGISSPLKAPTACSRLSPYLAWGCLSLRELVQATRARVAALPEGDRRRAGLSAFLSRLYWHCHFIQKLESEPALECRNLHRGYDGLREGEWNPVHFDALVAGRTGWPLVDACVAMLRETGWLNFRMRAMLVSVAAYPLWLHWRMPESVQARCGVRVGEDIALALVDLETATRRAKARVHALRAQPEVRAAKAAIVERHGSRKRPESRRRKAAPGAAQLDPGF